MFSFGHCQKVNVLQVASPAHQGYITLVTALGCESVTKITSRAWHQKGNDVIWGQHHLCQAASSPAEWRLQGAGRRQRVREVKDDGRESDCRWTSDNSAFKRSSRMTPRSEWYRGQSTWDAEKDNGVVDERRLSLCWILKKTLLQI